MKLSHLTSALVVATLLAGCSSPPLPAEPPPPAPVPDRLVEIATSTRRWTGLAISRDGRIFVNYPLWSDAQPFAVGELQEDGTVRPYPDTAMNDWTPGKSPQRHFVCVQALYVDAEDQLWILDPGNPRFEGVVEDAPKLLVVDLAQDFIVRQYEFGPDVAGPESYLNDLRVDLAHDTVYMTDSGNGAIVVLDLRTNQARRRLERHPSTQSEGIELNIGGAPWRLDGAVPQVHSDGIALSDDGAWLYYQALSGRTMYRIPTAALRSDLPEDELAQHVETLARSGSSDGLLYGPDGSVYISAIEHDAIRRLTPTGHVETVLADPRIAWPDSFALSPDGALYFTTARIHEGDAPTGPFAVYRLTLD